MTANRNLKQRVRARAQKTGESYTAAHRQLADGPRSVTVAAAQLPLLPDPGDARQIRASSTAVRTLMRQASIRGADLVHLPEGALTSPGKRVMSSTGPEDIGSADWDRADWACLARELDEVIRLAGQLRLWTVVGGIHRSASDERPGNCLFVISSRGQLIGRYDERMLSKTKSTLMYMAGRDPLVFTAGGVRFGCALGMETHYPELFSAYEEQDVDCVLFSTHGNAETPGIFAVEAAGHAAANSLWVSYAGPAEENAPPAGLVTPDGTWAARCAAGAPGVAVADVTTSTDSPARVWRRTARTSATSRSSDLRRPGTPVRPARPDDAASW
jgi:predicted amidohydrolase